MLNATRYEYASCQYLANKPTISIFENPWWQSRAFVDNLDAAVKYCATENIEIPSFQIPTLRQHSRKPHQQITTVMTKPENLPGVPKPVNFLGRPPAQTTLRPHQGKLCRRTHPGNITPGVSLPTLPWWRGLCLRGDSCKLQAYLLSLRFQDGAGDANDDRAGLSPAPYFPRGDNFCPPAPSRVLLLL